MTVVGQLLLKLEIWKVHIKVDAEKRENQRSETVKILCCTREGQVCMGVFAMLMFRSRFWRPSPGPDSGVSICHSQTVPSFNFGLFR